MHRSRVLSAAAAALLLAISLVVAGISPASAKPGGINGAGLQPAMGWSSWSFLRMNPTAATVEAQAKAMVSSGLAKAGFQYVNLDDFYYTYPADNPKTNGMNTDGYGRWVTDPAKFPPGPNGEDGLKVVADYVHSLGLKFGVYLTPGIPKQAVVNNDPIKGTPYHADDIVQGPPYFTEYNYNQGVMYRIDFTKPGAQEYYNSIADRFASWGADYLKFDGVRDDNAPDVIAMSKALEQTGRAIAFDTTQGSQDMGIVPTVTQWATQTVFTPDIENNTVSPALTSWANVKMRFNYASDYGPFVGRGWHQDLDSMEVGGGAAVDGLTPDERMTVLSLWSLGSSAWILGPDLTNIDPYDLSLLKNTDVIAVDQDNIGAKRVVNGATSQVFTKTEPNGDAIVGLFNTGSKPQVVSTTASAVGLPGRATGYLLNDLWTHDKTETAGAISATVAPHGVALYRITPVHNPKAAPPATTLDLAGLSTLEPGQRVSATVSFTDTGVSPAQHPGLTLSAPHGWKVSRTSGKLPGSVKSGQTVKATFEVVAPRAPTTDPLTARATYDWPGHATQKLTLTQDVRVALPVKVNEVQTGTTAASSDRFIELYNAGTAPVDLSGWPVVYRSSSSSSETTVATIPAGTTLAGGGYYLLAGAGYTGATPAQQTFTNNLSTSGGGVGLRDTSGALVDSVGWGTATNALVENCAAPAPPSTAPPGSSIIRQPNGRDTDSGCDDFAVTSTATPGASNHS
jgi:Lamin Tail Domain/Alpha galactosidase A/Alpha galactosidase C-terminal beta sandwich domain/NPCBM-associated, NEW3 domain of alpha-galactosidase